MTVDTESGIWTPRPVLKRYGTGLALNAYDLRHDGNGPNVLVSIEQMLYSLGMDGTPSCRAELKRMVMRIGQIEQVGFRVEQGVVSLWLTPALRSAPALTTVCSF